MREAAGSGSGGLTDAERRALELTAELMRLLADEVVGDGPEREEDLREIGLRVHGIQHMIMAQSAARAHPDLYRLLGGEGCLREWIPVVGAVTGSGRRVMRRPLLAVIDFLLLSRVG